MVDYTVMRIYQRTGENTGVSYPLWAVVLGVLMIPALAFNIIGSVWKSSPASVIFLVVVGALVTLIFWGLRRSTTADEREHNRLAAREQMELERNIRANTEAARVADLQRLRNKYRG